jgi:hypoxanthine phosphoribosyltransferase
MSVSDIETVLFDSNSIQDLVHKLACKIKKDYHNKQRENLVLVGILKGSYMFLSDLSRALDMSHTIDFMTVSSYQNTSSSGEIKIECDLRHPIKGKHVLIVEDIVDTGLTLSKLVKLLKSRGPKSVECCTLFSKSSKKICDVNVKYIGFDIVPPQFIVGYGLDYNERFRNLPFVGIPKKEAIKKYLEYS